MTANKATLSSKQFVSKMNNWKELMAHATDGLAVREWQQLKSWPAVPHAFQDRIDSFKALPSRKP